MADAAARVASAYRELPADPGAQGRALDRTARRGREARAAERAARASPAGSDLLVAGDALDGLVRSVIQHHGDAAAYAFAGSQPSLMKALFSEQERPFYGQARPLELPPLPLDEAAADIARVLDEDGLAAPDGAVDELLAFGGGHPQRTMVLAHHLYGVLAGAPPVDDPVLTAIARSTLQAALDRLLADGRQVRRDGTGAPFLLDPLFAAWLRQP